MVKIIKLYTKLDEEPQIIALDDQKGTTRLDFSVLNFDFKKIHFGKNFPLKSIHN